ncbi:hypothetical protein JTE90_010951 [Oedothorax gibbosus]|uniref:Thyroglobulin type-1 domain-containing protein n=1 Tax=Oedothorax gibbosus TaxID=931172 RepID=A0AAV6UBR2_9ARAC|nr:hypothetical protein JTE90_010951 [Oedothorax gibbosus]
MRNSKSTKTEATVINMLRIVGIIAFCLLAGAFAEDRPKSECEEDRARRLNATVTDTPVHLVPECEENGDYAAKQCFTNIDWCVCYRRNGENIGPPSKNIKACDCVRARDDARTNGDTYKPTCRKDGYYAGLQCDADECWCVDLNGVVTTEPQIGKPKCD